MSAAEYDTCFLTYDTDSNTWTDVRRQATSAAGTKSVKRYRLHLSFRATPPRHGPARAPGDQPKSLPGTSHDPRPGRGTTTGGPEVEPGGRGSLGSSRGAGFKFDPIFKPRRSSTRTTIEPRPLPRRITPQKAPRSPARPRRENRGCSSARTGRWSGSAP